MADIRINSLPTTASASSSDDFLALDGATNGTRKLNAYSPTFGGNLTVSGTGTQTLNGKLDVITAASSAANVDLAVLRQNYAGTAGHEGLVSFTNISGASVGKIGTRAVDGNNTSLVLRNFVSGLLADALTLSPSVATLAGNLTVSGASYNDFAGALWLGTTAGYGTLNVGNVSATGTATYSCLTIGDQSTPANATGIYMRGTSAVCGISTAGAPIAFFTGGPGTSEAARFFNNGNFGIGTGSTDGGQKLQVNGTIRSGSGSGETLSAGSIDVGADIGIASTQGIVQGGARIVTFTSGNATFAGNTTAKGTTHYFGADNSQRIELTSNNGSSQGLVEFYNRGTSAYFAARYLASSHTFEQGPIAINNTVQTAVAVASTHKVTISIGGSTYYLLATNV